MENSKFRSYAKVVVLTFIIYLILYYFLFVFLGNEEFDFFGMFFRGVILSLLIPLFNKKFSPFPKIYDEKSAKKGKKSILILAGSFISILVILFFLLYLAIKLVY